MESPPPEESCCAVCSTPCTKFCGNCRKVYYCSYEHQKQDRKSHKSQCFPTKLGTDPVKGRYIVASRDIKAGELLLRDEALIAAPNGGVLCSLEDFRPMCLSCFRILSAKENNHACAICGWPVCDSECEHDPSHTDYECPVFAENKIEPFTKATDYDFIKILRALFLSERSPTKWAQLLNLESHEEIREKLPSCKKKTFETVIFIRSRCKLVRFNYKVINYVVGVFRVNAFGNHNWPMPLNRNGVRPKGGFREGIFLFYSSSMFAHNCIPNTRSYLTQEYLTPSKSNNSNDSKTGEGGTRFEKFVLATVDIPEGAEITISYIETRQGVLERRQVLHRGYHFDCACARCCDPTEFGLNFSAVTCISCADINQEGYFLPKNSLDHKTVWKCTACATEISKEELLNTMDPIQAEIEVIKKDLKQNKRNSDNYPLIALQLQKIHSKFQGTKLHRNHWLLVELEYDIIKYARSTFLEVYKDHSDASEVEEEQEETTTAPSTWKEYLIVTASFIESITRHCLEIATVLRPGISIYRGCLLFSLAFCQYINLELAVTEEDDRGQAEKKKIDKMKADILASLTEAKSILIMEPAGSDEHEMASSVYDLIWNHVKKL